jgi:hypothetical protein
MTKTWMADPHPGLDLNLKIGNLAQADRPLGQVPKTKFCRTNKSALVREYHPGAAAFNSGRTIC